MQKKIWLFAKYRKGRRIFQLIDNVSGKPALTADSEIVKGNVNIADDVTVLAETIIKISKTAENSIEVEYKPPEGFDQQKFFPLVDMEISAITARLTILSRNKT